MARILEGETRQFHARVRQSDLAPRNIMLADDPRVHGGAMNPDSAPRVVLVDYSRAIVFQRTIRGLAALQENPLPQNPLGRFRQDDFRRFRGWVPENWHQQEQGVDSTRRAWLESTFGGEKAALYEPVEEEEEDPNSVTGFDWDRPSRSPSIKVTTECSALCDATDSFAGSAVLTTKDPHVLSTDLRAGSPQRCMG